MATKDVAEDDCLASEAGRMNLDGDFPSNNPLSSEDPPSLIASGLVRHYGFPLQASQAQLEELRRNQEVISESLERENERIEIAMNNDELQKLFEKTRRYTDKLIRIKRDMISLQERAAKLKKRALTLQLRKQKEAYKKEQQRRAEAEREKALVAKMAKHDRNPAE